jgi:hypothetical protein
MSILRFVEDFKTDGVTFNTSQEWEMYDSYTGIWQPGGDDTQEYVLFYRFIYPKDGKTYTVPEWIVVVIDEHTTNNRVETTQKEKWDKKVTRDQIKSLYGKEDYVKAAKEFMGINIAAKQRQEQTDYAYYYPLSAALERRSYED